MWERNWKLFWLPEFVSSTYKSLSSWSSMWPSPPGLRLEGGRGWNQIKHTRVSLITWGIWVVLGVPWCFGFRGSFCVFWNLYLPSITLQKICPAIFGCWLWLLMNLVTDYIDSSMSLMCYRWGRHLSVCFQCSNTQDELPQVWTNECLPNTGF
jgi:hypothetical protein